MPLATFKGLVIDSVDARRAGEFWASALGLDLHPAPRGAVLLGPTSAHTVWINEVPEPKVVKHRVHLDVHVADVDDLVAVGASVVDADSFRWVVMADPEGGEFCAFVREAPPAHRLYEISVDCVDPDRSARWWVDLLGGTVGREDAFEHGFTWIEPVPGAPFDGIVFAPVPEPKVGKNRIHLDVAAPAVEPIVAAGASVLRPPGRDRPWSVLADPEGNEFCVFRTA